MTHLLTPETVAAFRPPAELVPSHWRSERTTAADGTMLHWTDTGGDGPPVVLIHGVQVDGLSWLRTAQALEARHRVVMPDLRGHGRSGPYGPGTTTDTLVDDARRLLDAADVAEPVVVGHSMGADVAGRLAARGGLRGAVLVDPALSQSPVDPSSAVDDPPPWMRTLFDTLRSLGDQPHAERMVTGLGLLPPGPPPRWHEADYVTLVDAEARFDLDTYRHMTDGRVLAGEPDTIAAIDCPVLLMTARPMMPGVDVDAAVTAFTDHWRHGRHVHFPDSGHVIQADRFDRFVAVLTAFVADLDTR